MSLVELHAHSYYSFLDALASPEELVRRAAELGYSSLALTDHGGLFGIPRFMRAAQQAGVKPIVGCELYVSPTNRADRSPDLRPVGHHLTLLAETVEGYKNLVALSSAGYTEGFFHRPRVDRELLSAHSRGLILLTGCYHSAICERLRSKDRKGAEEWLEFYLGAFGKDRVHVEIQSHGVEGEDELRAELTRLAKSHRLRRVATNDVHYLHSADSDAHRMAMDIRSRKMPTDPRRVRFSKPAYGLLTGDEWAARFGRHPDALETAADIAGRCSVSPDDLRFKTLTDSTDRQQNPDALTDVVMAAARRRWGNVSAERRQRLTDELDQLKAAGLSQYMRMIHDLISEAKRQGIAIGPGRGSSAGSLVAFVLDIIEVDPIEYQLSFERFLSPSRKTLPDVDIDVDFRERGRLLDILHGLDPSAWTFRAGTISSIGLKSSLREAARVRGLPYRDVDTKIRSLPSGLARLEGEEEPPWSELAHTVNSIAPLPRMPMGHPTAVVIAPRTCADFLPVYATPEGERWLQYEGDDLDWMGIAKLDLLPLKTLAVMTETVRWLKIGGAADLNPRALPLNDRPTYAMMSRGETAGVFQLESPGMRELLRELSPDSIESLAAALALYRPGPLEAGLPRAYVARKNGHGTSNPPHPIFESILKDTFGLVLYQEQVLACARRVGLSAMEADDYRIAVSKKNPEAMNRVGGLFLNALLKAGLSAAESGALVAQFAQYAAFAFNKAHAVSYAILAYRSAYLKCHHPAAFLAATANTSSDDRTQLGELLAEVRRRGVRIESPDLNTAGSDCIPDPDGKCVRLGLRLIRHLPESVVSDILRGRPFADIPDLLVKVPSLLTAQSLEMLGKSGALDRFGPARAEILASLPAWAARVKQSVKQGGFQTDLFEETPEPPPAEPGTGTPTNAPPHRSNLFLEHEAIGCFATGSPMDDFREIVSEFSNGTLTDLANRVPAPNPEPGWPSAAPAVTAAGLLTSLRPHVDRYGQEMAFAKIEDETGSLEVVLFHDIFARTKPLLSPGTPLLVRGRLEKRGSSVTLVADQLGGMDQPDRLYESILLKLDEGIAMDALKRMKDVLKEYPGDRPVYVEMTDAGTTFEFRVGWNCRPTGPLRRKLEAILGPHSVFFLKTQDHPIPA